jgi:hypothetical protein
VSAKRVILLFVSWSVAVSSVATAQPQRVVGTLTTDGQGHPILTVQNLYSAALTAYGYEAVALMTSRSGSTSLTKLSDLRDAALDPTMQPIPLNQTEQVRIAAKSVRQVSFKAAVWADGATFGDPAWVQKLLQRRVVALRQAESLVELLQESIQAGRTPAMIVAVAKQGMAQVNREELEDPTEAATIESYYTQVIRRMTEGPPEQTKGATAADRERITRALAELTNIRDRLMLYR